MDAIKILGSILKSQMSSGRGNSDLLGSVLGSVMGGGSSNQSGGGLGDILGSLAGQLGGAQQQGQRQSQSGGLGGLLGSLLGGKQSSRGSSQQSVNPLEAILGGLTQGNGRSMNAQGSKDLGKLVMGALGGLAAGQSSSRAQQEPSFNVTQFDNNEAQDHATLLIRAMVNSAKSDGQIDEQEQAKILGQLGDEITNEEMSFVQQELQRDLDVQSFVASVPASLQQQVYAISLMTIKLDNQNEANYLNQLAQGFNMQPQAVNELHERMNAPKLYS